MGNRKKVAIGIIVVVVLIVLGPLQWYLEEKKETHMEKLILIAQNFEIGEGVTLQQGVRAFFVSAEWNSFNYSKDQIWLLATSKDGSRSSVIFHVNEKTGEVSIVEWDFNGKSLDSFEINFLIDGMIRAARR